ncbi:uncharacterized protein [Clytia hemisphaerica]|uniref:Uncharacterized protein n=1 Tax=Clytia hemisphaerica TaxID=252671 RepID=A0A7M5XLG4_9CNID
MSGEDYVHGINKMKRPATKVMAPPGGASQINIFGGAEAAPAHRVSAGQAQRNQSSIFGGDPPEQKAAPAKPTPAPAAQPSTQAAPTKSSITAPPENPTAPDGGRASSRVLAPPGGKTSINLFG